MMSIVRARFDALILEQAMGVHNPSQIASGKYQGISFTKSGSI